MAAEHSPASVPDEPLDIRSGLDTDGDARPDTLLTTSGGEMLIHTDLDGDGFADQVLGIAVDGSVHVRAAGAEPDADAALADPVITVWEP